MRTFEWDAHKAVQNLANHGVSFEEASTVFDDPQVISMLDEIHSADEDRYVVIGMSTRLLLLTVAYTMRGALTRIITARRVTQCERREYVRQ